MATFVFRLEAPRPTFALDMTGEEREIMGRHARRRGGAARLRGGGAGRDERTATIELGKMLAGYVRPS